MEVYVVTGEYGSGKTEFTLNLAIQKAKEGKTVAISDLDIINYYYRSRHASKTLDQYGIEVIGSNLDADHTQDLPAISYAANGVMSCKTKDVLIFDLAGSKNGAKVLAPFKDELIKNDAKMLFVVNVFRERTATAEGILEVVTEISAQAEYDISGFVNNSNLLDHTEVQNIIDGQNIIKEAANKIGVGIDYTFANKKFENDIKGLEGNKVFFDELIIRDK
jgi:capsule polysaccharide export protein KpsE/RkpR